LPTAVFLRRFVLPQAITSWYSTLGASGASGACS
jgi:hypothetical protein